MGAEDGDKESSLRIDNEQDNVGCIDDDPEIYDVGISFFDVDDFENELEDVSRQDQQASQNQQQVQPKELPKRKIEIYCQNCEATRDVPLIIRNCNVCTKSLTWRCPKCKHSFLSPRGAYYHVNHGCDTKSNSELIIELVDEQDDRKKDSHNRQPDQPEETSKDNIQVYCKSCRRTLDVPHVYSKSNVCNYCNRSESLSYRCRKCKYSYLSPGGVNNHLRFECGKQPQFQCEHCDYRAKRKDTLKNHMSRQHSMEKCRRKVGVKRLVEGDEETDDEEEEFSLLLESEQDGTDIDDLVLYDNEPEDDPRQDEASHIQQPVQLKEPLKRKIEIYCSNCEATRDVPLITRNCNVCSKSLIYRCLNCRVSYSSPFSVYKHMNHGCNKNCTTSETNTESHEKIQRGRKAAKDGIQVYCKLCRMTLNVAHVHGRNIVCSKCNGAKSLRYRCANCQRSYLTSHGADNHLRNDCNKWPGYQCPQCDYRAKQKSNLLQHIWRRHTVGKHDNCSHNRNAKVSTKARKTLKFQCDHCEYRCDHKGNLRAHIQRKHTDKKCRGCGLEFGDNAALRMHLLINKRCEIQETRVDRLFHCEHCDYRTKQKAYLSRHIHCKHSVRKCEACGREFRDVAKLKWHRSTKCKGRRCRFCQLRFLKYKSLKLHEEACGFKINSA